MTETTTIAKTRQIAKKDLNRKPTKRQQQAAETKQRIRDVGLQLLDEKGYGNVAIADIVNAAHVSTGTFYLYFKNKDDLFQSIERTPYAEIEEQLLDDPRPAAEQLDAYIHLWMKMLGGYTVNFTRNWIWYVANPDGNESDDNAQNKIYFDINTIRKILARGVVEGDLSPATPVERLAKVLGSALYGTTLRYCSVNASFSLNDWGDELACFMQDALQPYLSANEVPE